MKHIITAFLIFFTTLSYGSQDTIKLITMSGAGSMSDTVARFISPIIEKKANKPVLVFNTPGANGAIAARALITSKDENVLMLCNSNVAINENTKDNDIDYRGKIVPLHGLAQAPLILYANANLQISTVNDLKQFKEKNGRILFGSTGLNNIVIQDFSNIINEEIEIIPYRNATEMSTNAASGVIHMFFAAAGSSAAEGLVKQGLLKPITVISNKRSIGYPDVKTIVEQGFKKPTSFDWLAICTKRDYPEEQKKYLKDILVQMMQSEEIKGYERLLGNPNLWYADEQKVMEVWLTDLEVSKKFLK